jgi:hypothetical protein
MSHIWKKQGWKVLGLAVALAFARPASVKAIDFSVGCCQHFHCPHTNFCFEGAPHIHFHQGCAKPLINPCTQPNWGYYQTCWSPWPWPPEWNHCPVQPPASMVFPPGGPIFESAPNRMLPRADEPAGDLPPPRNLNQQPQP